MRPSSQPSTFALPDAVFDAAMADYLATQETRVRTMYNRHRAVFAEHLVAALLGGKVSVDPGAAWDIDWTPAGGRDAIRIQVKCSGEFLPRYPDNPAAAAWDVKPPKKGYNAIHPETPFPPGHNCDVFVLARHTGREITSGWRFVVASRRALADLKRINERSLPAAGLSFVAPADLARAVREVANCALQTKGRRPRTNR
jgi:hypothetical protein